MTITAGTRLGPYEIVAPLGAGGMGEVWRAVDTRLNRSVAIKVLPAEFAANAQWRARFEREAKSISQLSHPNICSLFDVGEGYLVMEMLEGESLADRLLRGPLPLDQVLRIGIEVASALHCAHRSGITHRDLKPGNVMLTRSGAKLLDFGLAKSGGAAATAVSGSAMTARHPLTEEGMIVGTYQYMSPEQLTGATVDSRSDVFALGALLYELISGRRAFEGKTKTSVIASILDRDPPPLSETNADAPPPLQRIVASCLAKDPEERWQSAHDVALELRALRDGIVPEAGRAAITPMRTKLGAAAVLLALVAAIAAGAYLSRRAEPPRAPIQLGLTPPPGREIEDFLLSPRGNSVAMIAAGDKRLSIWVRDLTTDALHEVPQSEEAHTLCWSPDGSSIAFLAKGSLYRVATAGGPPVLLHDGLGFTPGISWGADDTIIFASDGDNGINRIGAAGGAWTKITTVDASRHERRHMWPSFLPDGRHFLYLADSGPLDQHFLRIGSLDPKEPSRSVLGGVASNAQYAAGEVLFVRGRTLLAQPFDAERFVISGTPRVVAEQLADTDFHHYVFSAAADGALGYSTFDPRSRLHLLDRGGRELATFGEPADWVSVSWAPGGQRAVVERTNDERSTGRLWMADLTRGVFSQLGSPDAPAVGGNWSEDGTEVLYQTGNATRITRLDGSGGRDVPSLSARDFISSWSGDWVAAEVGSKSNFADVEAISISTGKHVAIATSAAWENVAAFSADGKWLAYKSGAEIIVQPFPPTGAEFHVSPSPGDYPRWRRDGRELYYFDHGGRLVALPIQVKGRSLEVGVAKTLFTVRPKAYKNRVPYDVSPDGQRFLINEQDSYERAAHVVLNWTAAKR